MKIRLALIAAAMVATTPIAHADRRIQTFSVQDAMNSTEYQERLDGFQFTWGDSVVGQRVGTTSTRKATNGVGKSDKRACEWALLSALLAVKSDAQRRGGSAVHGLKSTATGQPFSSATEFQCISGFTNSRVYLEGTIVK